MICFTNDDRLGGDPELMNKHKSLINLTNKLFKAAYKECKWMTPFVNLELEFMKFTDVTPTLEEIYSREKSD